MRDVFKVRVRVLSLEHDMDMDLDLNKYLHCMREHVYTIRKNWLSCLYGWTYIYAYYSQEEHTLLH